MENLKTLVYKGNITPYQKALAQREFEGLLERLKLFEEYLENSCASFDNMNNDDMVKDIYCIDCGQDKEDGTYKYHRTVANGDEWYCINCEKYSLH